MSKEPWFKGLILYFKVQMELGRLRHKKGVCGRIKEAVESAQVGSS